jgi:2-polyprenyl-6-methoxyphenol hydroxylase-like FAD-dependent oxidoreductase
MKLDTDVLIVGAGPVGLTIACYLHFHEISFRIIDKNSNGTETSNAIGVQSRTLELLNVLGIAEELVEAGNKLVNFHIESNKKELANWNLKHIDSIYPFLLSVSQKITEKVLIDYLTNANISVERETELISVNQREDHVEVKLIKKGNEEKITSAYISACDGYKSTLRQLLGIPYEGVDIPLNMIIIDASLTGLESQKTDGYTAFTDTLSVILLPLEKSWRIIADVAHEPKYHCAHNEKPTVEMFQDIIDRTMKEKITITKELWASKFIVHERLARTYFKNRIFLSGDAAHAHSPAGAQGMNTGMQDAVNLAWKLAFSIKHNADKSLLASYEAERRPIAKDIIKLSRFLIRFGTLRNKFLIKIRDFLVPKLSKRLLIQKRFANSISEVDVSYCDSPIVRGTKHADLSPGQRIPTETFTANIKLDKLVKANLGKTFILLDFTGNKQNLSTKYSAVVLTVSLPDEANGLAKIYGMEEGGYALIRPDQFIAYLGGSLKEIENYLNSIFLL